MTRLQIELPEALYRSCRCAAVERGVSLSEFVRGALESKVIRCVAERPPLATRALPEALTLGGGAFFDTPDWRYKLTVGPLPTSSALRAR